MRSYHYYDTWSYTVPRRHIVPTFLIYVYSHWPFIDTFYHSFQKHIVHSTRLHSTIPFYIRYIYSIRPMPTGDRFDTDSTFGITDFIYIRLRCIPDVRHLRPYNHHVRECCSISFCWLLFISFTFLFFSTMLSWYLHLFTILEAIPFLLYHFYSRWYHHSTMLIPTFLFHSIWPFDWYTFIPLFRYHLLFILSFIPHSTDTPFYIRVDYIRPTSFYSNYRLLFYTFIVRLFDTFLFWCSFRPYSDAFHWWWPTDFIYSDTFVPIYSFDAIRSLLFILFYPRYYDDLIFGIVRYDGIIPMLFRYRSTILPFGTVLRWWFHSITTIPLFITMWYICSRWFDTSIHSFDDCSYDFIRFLRYIRYIHSFVDVVPVLTACFFLCLFIYWYHDPTVDGYIR